MWLRVALSKALSTKQIRVLKSGSCQIFSPSTNNSIACNNTLYYKALQPGHRPSQRRVDHYSYVGVGGKLQGNMLKLQLSQRGMLHELMPIHCAAGVVIGPQTPKFRTDPLEILDQRFKPCVTRIACTGCAELS